MNLTFDDVDDVTDEEILAEAVKDKERIFKSIHDWSHNLKMMYPKGMLRFVGTAQRMVAQFADGSGVIGRWFGGYGAIYNEAQPSDDTNFTNDTAPLERASRRGSGFGLRGRDFGDDDFWMEGIEKMTTPEFSVLKSFAERVDAAPVAEPVVEEVVVETPVKTLKDYIKVPALVVADTVTEEPVVEEQKTAFPMLAELSKAHYAKYVDKAVDAVANHGDNHGAISHMVTDRGMRAKAHEIKKIEKRKKGVSRAMRLASKGKKD